MWSSSLPRHGDQKFGAENHEPKEIPGTGCIGWFLASAKWTNSERNWKLDEISVGLPVQSCCLFVKVRPCVSRVCCAFPKVWICLSSHTKKNSRPYHWKSMNISLIKGWATWWVCLPTFVGFPRPQKHQVTGATQSFLLSSGRAGYWNMSVEKWYFASIALRNKKKWSRVQSRAFAWVLLLFQWYIRDTIIHSIHSATFGSKIPHGIIHLKFWGWLQGMLHLVGHIDRKSVV